MSIRSLSQYRTKLTNTSTNPEDQSSKKDSAEADANIAQIQEELRETRDKYLRTLAEIENMRERTVRQINDAKMYAIQNFSKDIIAVADILEKATESVPQQEIASAAANQHFKSLYEGLKLTESQLQKVFSAHGLRKIYPINEKFDPNFHEALFQVENGEKPDGSIAQVSKAGYLLHGRTLRPAMVGVTKAP
ncbi:uncharacterized protein TRIADDRAFT_21754 [Trichoplax adhaerens]|uniref:GrpE protein homolog n=1 Tax=Trichoplax adhaerens TaxID=10228 RepID=B3RNA7_TRIAD|nr:hypothetical protein TRIADDRAFT_21754 [Trichoplax adhaerens]EDV27988.1 hypothetical protein TRIADDRAFT_21754 [Trichoplax adhaerens]|eukprot:XP_002109822.1 hypothetical protein TRIADDRAFT_21754 [Trichoplax adhaerens]